MTEPQVLAALWAARSVLREVEVAGDAEQIPNAGLLLRLYKRVPVARVEFEGVTRAKPILAAAYMSGSPN